MTTTPSTARRRGIRALLVAVVTALLGLSALLATTHTAQAATAQTSTLVGVRAAAHPGFDRVVWQFDGPVPTNRQARIVSALYQDGSGKFMPVAGNAILQVSVFSTQAHRMDSNGQWQSTVPMRQSFGLPNVTETVLAGDFEAVVTYGIGLNKNQSFTMFTLANPSRIVLDIRTDYPTRAGTVRFVNMPNYSKGIEPYTTAASRTLVAAAPAGAALNHLFAGPTAAEFAAGLRVVKSEATGWKNLSISNGVARVTLTGGCNSRGSTMTIANLITPTLKQFSTVRYVKIYDPAGRTERPTGYSDSIPFCLEP